MNIMEYYTDAFKRFADFNGRATVRQFWMFVLINFAITFAISLIGINTISAGYSLVAMIPSMAIGVRRLHDIGKSGWYCCLAFIPLVGVIILIIWFIKAGDVGPNAYGEDPNSPVEE